MNVYGQLGHCTTTNENKPIEIAFFKNSIPKKIDVLKKRIEKLKNVYFDFKDKKAQNFCFNK